MSQYSVWRLKSFLNSAIACFSNLKKGGIYRHFPTKEELAAEAFDYTWEAAWNARLLHVEKANSIEKLRQRPSPKGS
jgi:AcrR family transcriptional regulator